MQRGWRAAPHARVAFQEGASRLLSDRLAHDMALTRTVSTPRLPHRALGTAPLSRSACTAMPCWHHYAHAASAVLSGDTIATRAMLLAYALHSAACYRLADFAAARLFLALPFVACCVPRFARYLAAPPLASHHPLLRGVTGIPAAFPVVLDTRTVSPPRGTSRRRRAADQWHVPLCSATHLTPPLRSRMMFLSARHTTTLRCCALPLMRMEDATHVFARGNFCALHRASPPHLICLFFWYLPTHAPSLWRARNAPAYRYICHSLCKSSREHLSSVSLRTKHSRDAPASAGADIALRLYLAVTCVEHSRSAHSAALRALPWRTSRRAYLALHFRHRLFLRCA